MTGTAAGAPKCARRPRQRRGAPEAKSKHGGRGAVWTDERLAKRRSVLGAFTDQASQARPGFF
jgi:hypothetical protein